MQKSPLQKTYEKYPYPAADETALTKERWNLPPMDWIRTLWKPEDPNFAPDRILVAGCGTGSEAFSLRRRFPESRIVAVDFSPRSISIAKTLQKQVRAMRDIRFLVGDLADRKLEGVTGGAFDFISCHGVLSYIPAPRRVLSNFARCLAPGGALYLGVNGSEHFSARGRTFLPEFGFAVGELRDQPALRLLLQLWDTIADRRDSIEVGKYNAGYLAGDLFGKLIHNLPLAEWLRLTDRTGLHFQGSFSCWGKLRAAMEKEYYRVLFPQSRSEVCRSLELIAPSAFHRLLFTRQAEKNPDWQNPEQLRACFPLMSSLYSVRQPRRSAASRKVRRVTFKSPVLNTRLDWEMPEWEREIVRHRKGRQTIGQILERIPNRIPERSLQKQLYLLHQLLVMTLAPPAGSSR